MSRRMYIPGVSAPAPLTPEQLAAKKREAIEQECETIAEALANPVRTSDNPLGLYSPHIVHTNTPLFSVQGPEPYPLPYHYPNPNEVDRNLFYVNTPLE